MYAQRRKVLEAKQDTYPAQDTIIITEFSACVTLQGLLDVTIRRLMLTFQSLPESLDNHKLVCKHGFDGSSGSSGKSQYKQHLTDGSAPSCDQHMFLTALVPVRIYSGDTVVWTYERANSTRLCRPVKFQFVKETYAVVEENERLQGEINSLHPTCVKVSGKHFHVSHELMLTMIDGKICAYLAGTESMQRCPNCRALPTEMSDLDQLENKAVNEQSLLHGFSPLYSPIRFFEYLINIAKRNGLGKLLNV